MPPNNGHQILAVTQQQVFVPHNAKIQQLVRSSLLTLAQTSPNSPLALKKESLDNIKERINDYCNNCASIQNQHMFAKSFNYIENKMVIDLKKYLNTHCKLFLEHLKATTRNIVEKTASTN